MLEILLTLIGVGTLCYGLFELAMYIMRRRSAEMVEPFEMMPNIRRVQVIDVREEAEFRARHILGARHIPYSQFNMRHQEIRRDTPVYLYGDGKFSVSRAADILRKNNYPKDKVFILKGGIENWPGKVKSDI